MDRVTLILYYCCVVPQTVCKKSRFSWNILRCAGIFFDTYGEYYEDMREFHQHLPRLLKPGGIYSYFNGLCGDNAFFHVVYCQLVSLELANLGYATQFIPLPVKDCLSEQAWEGVKQKYWQLDTYHLPVVQAETDSEWVILRIIIQVKTVFFL